MKKQELLSRLIENKAKHDVILNAAISGYWEIAQTVLQSKQKKLSEQLAEWQSECDLTFEKYYRKVDAKEELPVHVTLKAIAFDSALGLVFPQDHSRDYNRAIAMMQSSVYDEVQLTVDEYDAYVLNNWEWKKNFMVANSLYVNAVRGKLGSGMYSGCMSPHSLTGNFAASYDNAANTTYELMRSNPSGYLAAF